MRTVSALAFRRQFGRVLDEVVKKREPITITRANQPLAVLVPAEDFNAAGSGALSREHRLRLVAERLDSWRDRNADALRRLDAVALVRETRADR
jgi:prevent-host-death family protein